MKEYQLYLPIAFIFIYLLNIRLYFCFHFKGTSDEHITIMENLKTVNCDGAIIVTSPQEVSVEDVRKEVTFCKKTGIPIIGIIENLSG